MGDTLDLPPYKLPAVLLWQAGTKSPMSGTRQAGKYSLHSGRQIVRPKAGRTKMKISQAPKTLYSKLFNALRYFFTELQRDLIIYPQVSQTRLPFQGTSGQVTPVGFSGPAHLRSSGPTPVKYKNQRPQWNK